MYKITYVTLDNPQEFRRMFGFTKMPAPRYQTFPPETFSGSSHRYAFSEVIERIFDSIRAGDRAEGEQAFALLYLCRHSIEIECKEFIWHLLEVDPSSRARLEDGDNPQKDGLEALRRSRTGHDLGLIGQYTARAIDVAHGPGAAAKIRWPKIQEKLELWQKADPYGDIIRYGRDVKGYRYHIGHNLSVLPAYGLYKAIHLWVGRAAEAWLDHFNTSHGQP